MDTNANVSGTNSVSFSYVLSDTLRVRATGSGTLSPNDSNAVLQIGKSYSMTATATNGFAFTNWVVSTDWSGGVVSNNATLNFVMRSNLTLQVNFVDVTRPTNTITAPTAGQRWSNSVFTVTGTARDNAQVANVLYQLNAGSWTNALSVNGWTNWTASVLLLPGTNTLKAYAVDAAGNLSTTNSVSLQYVVTNQLQVQMSGRGTISPNYSNAWLEIGRGYSMTATATNGFAFTNWVISTNWIGGMTTNNTIVQFLMQSNLTLQANFADVTKPTNTITAPTANQQWSNFLFNVTGKAGDNAAVSNVFYSLNGGAWTNATTTNAWSNWLAVVTLVPGTNTVQAYAVDTSGNVSATNSVKLVAILNFAFDYIGTYLNPQIITYTNKSGQIVEASGFPGQVQLFVTSNATPSVIQAFAQANGGSVIAQIPPAGYYLVSVTPGDEASFITAANANSSVLLSFPSVPETFLSDVVDLRGLLGPNGELPVVSPFSNNGLVGNNTYLYVPDRFASSASDFPCKDGYITHGAAVDYLASHNLAGTGEQINVDPVPAVGTVQCTAPNDYMAAYKMALDDLASHPSGRGVVNISTGPGPICPQNVYSNNVVIWFTSLAELLNKLPSNVLQRVVFVVAAGNGDCNGNGVDLSHSLEKLHYDYTNVFGLGGSPHMIIVGAQGDATGTIDAGDNYTTDSVDTNGNPLMVYAPASNIPLYPAGGTNVCTGNGTSLATPAVSSLIAQMLAANPNLTLGQNTEAFMDAAEENTSPYWMPSTGAVQQVITNLYYSTLTIQTTGGTGTGTVAPNPPGPTYTNGTAVTLTATPDAYCTFVGWSGDASGTNNPTVIMMNTDKNVVAAFDDTNFLAQISVDPTLADAGSIGGCPGGSATETITVTAPANVTWQAYWINGEGFSTGGGSGAGSGSFNINIVVPPDSPTPGFSCSDLADFDYYEEYEVDFYGPDGSGLQTYGVEVDWVYLLVL